MSTIGLFGQTLVEPMHVLQMRLFHEPIAAPPVVLPGTTAQDRTIAAKFAESDTAPFAFPVRPQAAAVR